jgi:anti-sigma factor RsiW
MNGKVQSHAHWSGDELLHRLYGLTEGGAGCAGCEARLEELRARAAASRAEPLAGDEFLRRQRLAIFARVEGPPRRAWMWRAPASAAALLFVAVLALEPPGPVYYEPEIAAVSDAQFFGEVAEELSRDAPRAASPIECLFEGSD